MILRGNILPLLALGFGLCLGACKGDPTGTDTDGGPTETAACEQGTLNCECYGNDTCNPGLQCQGDVCAECPEGTVDCPCFANETCFDGLECIEDTCASQSADDGTSDETTDDETDSTSDETTDDGTSEETTEESTEESTSSDTTDESTDDTGEEVYTAVGPQTNVPVNEVVGWTICYEEAYNAGETLVATALSDCDGDELMLACKHPDDDFYTLLAHAPREDVLMEQPWPFSPHQANGSGWYFYNPDTPGQYGAIGFVNAGDVTDGGVCDVEIDNEQSPELRLCWHTRETFMFGGFRCGMEWPLNDSLLWRKVMLHR